MGRRTKTSFQKREREKRKAEKASRKRELREERSSEPKDESEEVATEDDLAGYGLAPEESEELD
jgi:hypothetical protein